MYLQSNPYAMFSHLGLGLRIFFHFFTAIPAKCQYPSLLWFTNYYMFTISSIIWSDIAFIVVIYCRFSPRIRSWHSKMLRTCFSVSTITGPTFYRNLNGQTLIYYWNMMVLTKKYFSLKWKIFCLLNNDLWFWDPAQP